MGVKNLEKAVDDIGKRKIAGKTVGAWAFIIGLILATVIAINGLDQQWPFYILFVLGLIVGLFNITEKEVSSFLLAAVVFILTFAVLGAVYSGIAVIGENLAKFFSLLNAFVAAAAVVVAFKALFANAKN